MACGDDIIEVKMGAKTLNREELIELGERMMGKQKLSQNDREEILNKLQDGEYVTVVKSFTYSSERHFSRGERFVKIWGEEINVTTSTYVRDLYDPPETYRIPSRFLTCDAIEVANKLLQ